MTAAKIRLYVDEALGPGQTISLSQAQAHYLFGVMRRGVGDEVALFNGRDGEYLARVADSAKRRGVLMCEARTRPLQKPPDLWLLFAPIKKARTDFIVEKATELGVARIYPVRTAYTNSERIRRDRLQAHAIEAAEQCGGTYVPEVADLEKLSTLLEGWPRDRKIAFCDETLAGAAEVLTGAGGGKWAILDG
ncbi:MAG: 16S rRNA (uracil(1498)-N(3))-methyltransferase, partial [Halocynthiibacter sp.]